MRRIIDLSDDRSAGENDTATLVLSRPDTLELIRRPDPPAAATGGADDEPPGLEEVLQRFHDERRHRRSVRLARVLVGLLAVGLLAVWLLHPPASGGEENRATARFPTLTPSGLANGSDYRQADAALRDRLALRRYVVKAIGQTAQDRLGTSLNPEVVLGADGIPFITEDFTLPCEHDFDPAAVDAGLRELRALGRVTGKTITIAIAPDKSSILPNELGRRGRALMACADRVRRGTEATWGGASTPPVLTVWRQMAAEEKAEPGQIFQHGDSHWTSLGALVWSKAVIAQLIAQGEAPAQLQGAPHAFRAADQPADGDLYRLMGIPRDESVRVYDVSRPDVRMRARSVPSPSGHGIATFHAESATAALIPGRTLVIDDSFFSRAEGQLAPYFSDLTVLHWADFLTFMRQGRLPPFDRVIVETVQRGWPERAGWLEPGQPVHAALARELERATDTPAIPPPQPAPSS